MTAKPRTRTPRFFQPTPQACPRRARRMSSKLGDGELFEMTIEPVAKRVGDATVRMLGYGGSVPGPTLRVPEGGEIHVRVENRGDLEATVHWHGLRLENRYDGVPHETQEPIPVGGTYTTKIQFPDPGFSWYHPHMREDFAQDLGLQGTGSSVEPSRPFVLAAC